MRRLISTMDSFFRDERGSTAIEYAVIASGVGGAIMAIVFTLGETTLNKYYQILVDAIKG